MVIERAPSERPEDVVDAVIEMGLQAVGRIVSAGFLPLIEPLPEFGDAPDGFGGFQGRQGDGHQ